MSKCIVIVCSRNNGYGMALCICKSYGVRIFLNDTRYTGYMLMEFSGELMRYNSRNEYCDNDTCAQNNLLHLKYNCNYLSLQDIY